jgi:PilZ domain
MLERRQYGRFPFPFPVRLETITTNGKKVLDLVTKDISACGTFIPTLMSFPEGTRFNLDLTFPSNHQPLQDVKVLKGYIGSLVRSTPHGIAIQFDRECQMENFKAL